MSCSRSLFGLELLLVLKFRLNRLFLIHVQTQASKLKIENYMALGELRYICLCFITSCSLHPQLAIRSEVKWYAVYNFLPRKNNNLWVMSLIICFLQVYWDYTLLSRTDWDDLFFSFDLNNGFRLYTTIFSVVYILLFLEKKTKTHFSTT